jgi:hypothetical protein
MLGRIDGAVEPALLESAVRQVVHEAEPLRASFFELDGKVFQKAIDYPYVELARYDLMGSRDPARDAYRPGWQVVYGESDHAACLEYIEQNWTDIRPKSLRQRLAEGQGA